MSYQAAVARLWKLAAELYTRPGEPRRKFDLDQVRVLMQRLGNPEKRFPSVLIAGTNGKGSTAATLAAILAASGYSVGLYTSPHLLRVNERIQLLRQGPGTHIAQDPISDDAFAELFAQVEAAADELVHEGRLPAAPSFFEALTAMAFSFFAAEPVDIAVLEVGMGGRLDATNIVDPLLSIITDISLDHMEWLGPTVAAIAREKAGILRPGGVMVTLPQHPEANQVLGEVAVPIGVRGVSATEYLPGRGEDGNSGTRNQYSVEWQGAALLVDSPLAGAHQQRNLALALAAATELRNCYGYHIERSAVERGIRETCWPGRMQHYPATHERARVLLDVGHNPAGAWALRSALAAIDDRVAPRTLIFGCLSDKPVAELAQILFPMFDRVLLAPLDSPRSAPLDRIGAAALATGTQAHACNSVQEAWTAATIETPVDGLIVGTGSVLLVGALQACLHATDRSRPADRVDAEPVHQEQPA